MKVYFSCTTKDILEHKEEYQAIRQAILDSGHTLTRDWLEYSIECAEKGKEDVPSSEVYHEVISAILAADVVVFEGTVRSMSIGYQLTFALEKNKPVLLLAKLPKNSLGDLFITGAQSPLLTVERYTDIDNLTQLVKDYLNKEDGRANVRFNLVMDKKQDNYLEWASYTYDKSKSDLIREAIDNFIEKDERYKKYLGPQ